MPVRFRTGDKITLTGFTSNNVTLKTVVKNLVDIDNDSNNLYLFTFENDSEYVKILYNHELPPIYLNKNDDEKVEVEIIV